LTASVLRTDVTWQGTNVKLTDDEIEMSKHVAVYTIQRDKVVICNCVTVVLKQSDRRLMFQINLQSRR
jgi:hypothetical protein